MAENFSDFFECWLVEQNNYLEELVQAYSNGDVESEEHEKQVLIPLIEREIKHYEQYYETKSKWVKEEAFAMLNPSWTSNLEDGFLWIGGWRPSMAFHLLYSKTGLKFEEKLTQLLEGGMNEKDVDWISSDHLSKIDELQRKTIREEREITEKMAKQQQKVADPAMVELSHIVSEMMRANMDENGMEEENNKVESTLAKKKDGMVWILQRADDLRLQTLKEIVEILRPIQSVNFLIAGSELHLRVHDCGKKMDVPHAADAAASMEIATTVT